MKNKSAVYERIFAQLSNLLADETDHIAAMAAIAALLHHKIPQFYWTGFYRLTSPDTLIVGPYQGTLACRRLTPHTGVCWKAVDSAQTVIVPDVSAFPGHIACDPKSKSEIAIPCLTSDNKPFAVLDIDSDKLSTFDQTDKFHLEKIVTLIPPPH